MNNGLKGRAGPLGPPESAEKLKMVASPSGRPSGPSLPQRKTLPHGISFWVKAGSVFFVTICCADKGRNQLCLTTVANTLFEAVQFRQDKVTWHVHLLVLMPDYLHMLVSFPQDEAMKEVISNFKEMTSKKSQIHWQRDFFDHRLRTDESYDEKAFYIRMNPVRKGLFSSAEKWAYVWPSFSAAGQAVPPTL